METTLFQIFAELNRHIEALEAVDGCGQATSLAAARTARAEVLELMLRQQKLDP